MKRYLHWFVLLAFLLALVFDAVVWAGAAQMSTIGNKLQTSARREGPLTTAYMTLGKPLLAVPVLRDYGSNYAQEAFAPLVEPITETPMLAMELAHGEARTNKQGTLQFFHLAAPLLLLAWIVAYLMRPKEVHFVRTVR